MYSMCSFSPTTYLVYLFLDLWPLLSSQPQPPSTDPIYPRGIHLAGSRARTSVAGASYVARNLTDVAGTVRVAANGRSLPWRLSSFMNSQSAGNA